MFGLCLLGKFSWAVAVFLHNSYTHSAENCALRLCSVRLLYSVLVHNAPVFIPGMLCIPLLPTAQYSEPLRSITLDKIPIGTLDTASGKAGV